MTFSYFPTYCLSIYQKKKKKKKKKKNISKSLEKKKTAILKKFKAFKGKDDPSNKRKH